MIDTIRGYLELNSTTKYDLKPLVDKSYIVKSEKGIKATCNVQNFKVYINCSTKGIPYRLSFYGSLPKFYFGNNIKTLSRRNTLEAVNMLSDNLNVHIKKAHLTRVDFGINVILDYPVYEYINCLFEYPRLEWMRFSDSMTFFTKHGSKSLIFYDKIKEQKRNQYKDFQVIPNKYVNSNLLRYELRLKKRLNNRFKKDQLKVRHLYRKETLEKAKTLLIHDYNKVIKSSNNLDPKNLLLEYNGVLKYLSYHGITNIGYNRFEKLISQYDFGLKSNSMKRSKSKTIVKNIINLVNQTPNKKNLIKELDYKVLKTINSL